jgi:hypothetical protein
VVFLGEGEELGGFRRALGDLGLQALDGYFLAKDPDLLDLVGIDGVIHLKVGDPQGAHGALALAEGLARAAAGASLDQHAVLGLVLLDGDIERVDAHRLEETHLADGRGDIGDLAESIREAHDAEGVLGKDVENGHGSSSSGISAR